MKEEFKRKVIEDTVAIVTLHIFMSASYFAHLYNRKFNDLPSLEEVVFVLEKAYKGFKVSVDYIGEFDFCKVIKPTLQAVQFIPPIIEITGDKKVKSIEIDFEYVLPEISRFIESYVKDKKLSLN